MSTTKDTIYIDVDDENDTKKMTTIKPPHLNSNILAANPSRELTEVHGKKTARQQYLHSPSRIEQLTRCRQKFVSTFS